MSQPDLMGKLTLPHANYLYFLNDFMLTIDYLFSKYLWRRFSRGWRQNANQLDIPQEDCCNIPSLEERVLRKLAHCFRIL